MEAVLAVDQFGLLRRDRGDDVELPGDQPGDPRRDLRHRLVGDRRQRRTAAPVVVERLQDHGVLGFFGNVVGAGADRIGGEGRVAELGIDRLGHDLADAGGQPVLEGGVRRIGLDDHRIGVDRLGADDRRAEPVRTDLAALRRQGEGDVFGGHLRAVVERHPVADLQLPQGRRGTLPGHGQAGDQVGSGAVRLGEPVALDHVVVEVMDDPRGVVGGVIRAVAAAVDVRHGDGERRSVVRQRDRGGGDSGGGKHRRQGHGQAKRRFRQPDLRKSHESVLRVGKRKGRAHEGRSQGMAADQLPLSTEKLFARKSIQ